MGQFVLARSFPQSTHTTYFSALVQVQVSLLFLNFISPLLHVPKEMCALTPSCG